MKNSFLLKKLSKNELKQITGAGRPICCQVYCGTGECSYWTEFPAKCPLLEACA